MHLKKQLKAHIKKANIPDISKKLMAQLPIPQKNQNFALNKSSFILQFSAFLFLFLGVVVFSYQQSSSQIYAFTEYEEVLGLTAGLIVSIDEQDSVISTTSLSSTAPTNTEIIDMLSYVRYIENIVVTQHEITYEKQMETHQERLSIRMQSLSQSELLVDMNIIKEYQNFKQDVFRFEATFNETILSGYTQLKDQNHMLHVSATTNNTQLTITYDSAEKQFDVLKTGENISERSFSFTLNRNNLLQPIIEFTYEKDDSEINMIAQYSPVKKIMQVRYAIYDQSPAREGNFEVKITFDQGIIVEVSGETDQGETFQYQFQRAQMFSSDFQ